MLSRKETATQRLVYQKVMKKNTMNSLINSKDTMYYSVKFLSVSSFKLVWKGSHCRYINKNF